MRRLWFPTVLALTAGSLTACTPAPLPVAALAVVGERIVVVMVACGGHSVISIDEDERPSRHTTVSVYDVLPSWSVEGGSPPEGEVTEIVAFGQPPAGWKTEKSELTELQPDVQYALRGWSDREAASVWFRSADLENLGPDVVVTAADDYKNKIVKRSSFEKKARASCP
ncbi:hypothetical protein AB0F49_19225 [Micromonospora ureilytica]|uniref:hypothetical protein n=1 Tax=Micromonospora ureilytica TaxID=709868 RepID=UPI0033D5C8CD